MRRALASSVLKPRAFEKQGPVLSELGMFNSFDGRKVKALRVPDYEDEMPIVIDDDELRVNADSKCSISKSFVKHGMYMGVPTNRVKITQ